MQLWILKLKGEKKTKRRILLPNDYVAIAKDSLVLYDLGVSKDPPQVTETTCATTWERKLWVSA